MTRLLQSMDRNRNKFLFYICKLFSLGYTYELADVSAILTKARVLNHCTKWEIKMGNGYHYK